MIVIRGILCAHEFNITCQGPYDCVAVDQNEKLGPYGFNLHAAIDVCSNRLLWLEVINQIKNPRVIGKLFLVRKIYSFVLFSHKFSFHHISTVEIVLLLLSICFYVLKYLSFRYLWT